MLRTCLFDMGNVLVFFSHDRMCEQIGRLCGQSTAEIKRLLIDSGVQWDYERGRLGPEDFRRWFHQATGADVSMADLCRAASDIFWPNVAILPVLDRLKELGLRLVLLSNTCVTHFEWVQREYDVLNRFDDFVTSFEIGAIKPEPEIFNAALRKIDCLPDECFYTDDIAPYVAAGREHGLQAEVFTDVPQLIQHLRIRGIEV